VWPADEAQPRQAPEDGPGHARGGAVGDDAILVRALTLRLWMDKENLPVSQCTAKSKKSGERCRRRARAGYPVCIMHGAGKGAKRGGRPPVHGRYSKFLSPDEQVDFEEFKKHFDLTEDLAFAATKTYHAASQVKPEQLPTLLEVPSKIAERRKRVLEGVTLKVDLDVDFLRTFVAKVLTYVPDPTAQERLLTFVEGYLGESAGG
jgi:hypothetical protein